MNEKSSRSHFVFTLRITGVNEVYIYYHILFSKLVDVVNQSSHYFQSTAQQVQGVLNLVDLAGSERLSRSGSTGDRLKETQVYSYTYENFLYFLIVNSS